MAIREIKADALDMACRLRGIDEDNRLYYNDKTGKYELHNVRCNPSYQLTFPYLSLDSRMESYTRRTRAERMYEELKAVDEYNERLSEKNSRKIADEAAYKSKQLFQFIANGGSEIPSYDKL